MSDNSTVLAQRIDDLVVGTLQDLGRNRLVQIAQDLQRYEIMGKWLKEDKMTFDSGIGVRRTLMTKYSEAARHVGLFAPDSVDIPKLLTTVEVPWRHATTSWAYEIREMMINTGEARINNVIKPRRVAALLSLAQELETKAWQLPDPDSDVMPYGIPYWIVANQTEGFNGGHPAGFSSVGGVNVTKHPNFMNWTNSYTNVTKQDLIRKMRKGFVYTEWKSPVGIEEFRGPQGRRLRYYCPYSVLEKLETIGEAQNDNLGRDIAPYDGMMTFRRVPIINVFQLDEDSQEPIYGIDHEWFTPICLKGDYLRETGPERAPNQRNVRIVGVDLTYNYMCLNRRAQQLYVKKT